MIGTKDQGLRTNDHNPWSFVLRPSSACALPAPHARVARAHDRLGAIGHLEFAEDIRHVILHGLEAQHQLRCDSALVAPCAIVER